MDIEPTSAPATKADIATVLAELRVLRLWAEGKFERVEEKFATQDQRTQAVVNKAMFTLTWRFVLAQAGLIAAVIGSEAFS